MSQELSNKSLLCIENDASISSSTKVIFGSLFLYSFFNIWLCCEKEFVSSPGGMFGFSSTLLISGDCPAALFFTLELFLLGTFNF